MLQKLKIIPIMLVALLVASTAIVSPVSGLSLDVAPSGFALEKDDILAFDVTETSEGGVPGLTIELQDEDDQSYNTTLDAGDTVAIGIDKLPDWAGDPTERVEMNGIIKGGHFTLNYSAPFEATIPFQDDGPALFNPIITIGDSTYWADFATAVGSAGFTTTSNSTHFTMSYSNSTHSFDIGWTKADGVMDSYRYEWQEENVNKIMDLVRADWDLIPSTATTLDYSTTDALLDYTVTDAAFEGADGLFNFSAIEIGEGDDGPMDADGVWYEEDVVHVNIDEYRSVEESAGYLAGFENENGYIYFNISINLPSPDLQRNNMYLYPQFLIADDAILEGYLNIAGVMDDAYSTSLSSDMFSISYENENGSLTAEWERSTGFLTYWKMNNTVEDQLLELDLLAGEDLDSFGINYDHVVIGDGNTYVFSQIDVEGDSQLPLDEGDNPGVGYIGEGDQVYVEPIAVDLEADDGPPTIYYDINGTNGHQANVSFNVDYPGFDEIEDEGPPLLMFHHLDGTAGFFDWVELLYDSTGGSYDMNSTHISLSYSGDQYSLEEVFRTSDMAMVYYYYEDAEGNVLEIELFSDDNVFASDGDDGGIALPLFDSYTTITLVAFFVAIPILRRRVTHE